MNAFAVRVTLAALLAAVSVAQTAEKKPVAPPPTAPVEPAANANGKATAREELVRELRHAARLGDPKSQIPVASGRVLVPQAGAPLRPRLPQDPIRFDARQ